MNRQHVSSFLQAVFQCLCVSMCISKENETLFLIQDIQREEELRMGAKT